jgi:hypothetical protein
MAVAQRMSVEDYERFVLSGVETRIPVSMLRGDLELWRVHPYEGAIRSWVRQADGTDQETVYAAGTIRLTALPRGEITVADLFDC